MSVLKIRTDGCTPEMRRVLANDEYEDGVLGITCLAILTKEKDMAIDLLAFPPDEDFGDPEHWDYGFGIEKWQEDDGFEPENMAPDVISTTPIVDIDWLNPTWKTDVENVLIEVFAEVYAAERGDYRFKNRIYCDMKKENCMYDVNNVYLDLREDGKFDLLPKDVAENIATEFSRNYDWTVPAYDQMKVLVEKAMENLKPKGASFHDDVDKMIDFFHLSREDFLERYDYLTEVDYDATIEAVRQQCDIKETVAEGVALYALIMLRDYKSED